MTGAFWVEFELDPRHPSFAPLRASDRDRELVNGVLTEGYAQGRLDGEELDARTATLAAARTLGELPPLVTDLVTVSPSATHGRVALESLVGDLAGDTGLDPHAIAAAKGEDLRGLIGADLEHRVLVAARG